MKNNVLKVMLWGDEVGKIYWDEQQIHKNELRR